jgi:hypothetical protein
MTVKRMQSKSNFMFSSWVFLSYEQENSLQQVPQVLKYSVVFSPQANYTDGTAAACRPS